MLARRTVLLRSVRGACRTVQHSRSTRTATLCLATHTDTHCATLQAYTSPAMHDGRLRLRTAMPRDLHRHTSTSVGIRYILAAVKPPVTAPGLWNGLGHRRATASSTFHSVTAPQEAEREQHVDA